MYWPTPGNRKSPVLRVDANRQILSSFDRSETAFFFLEATLLFLMIHLTV